jgi:hypothetical protein
MKGKLKEWLKEHGKESAGKLLNTIGENTSIPILSNIIESIGEGLMNDPNLSEQEKQEAAELIKAELEFYKIDAEDRANARNMQIVALGQEDKFSKRFVYYMAIFWSVVGGTYLFLVTFADIANPQHANTIIGFLLGTIVSTIINFFFGSSKGSKDKTNLLGQNR